MNMQRLLGMAVLGMGLSLSGMAMAGAGAIGGDGQLNTIDPQKQKVNMQHGAIPDLGWPAMTMDFTVAPGVDLKTLRPGQKVTFQLSKAPDGQYQISKITPLP